MEPERLKAEFGDRVTFWGGIDTQRILPFGTPDEVRAEVRRIIDILGPGGGFVLNSVHNIQAEVPPENVVAMFDEARSYRRH
jgi:uroporphyrinogen decarboxylase